MILCYMQKDHFVAENIQMNIQLINFNILLGLSLTLICFKNDKSCSDTLYDMVNSVLKAADCDSATYFAEITRAHGWITFCLFKGKININTIIHIDLRQIGCYFIRPEALYNNS